MPSPRDAPWFWGEFGYPLSVACWAIRMPTSCCMPSAMRSWERRRWGISAAISRMRTNGFGDVASTKFLQEVARLMEAHTYAIVNVDATVVLESPRIAAYVPRMRETIARVLDLEIGRVSVKATTHERLGALGKGEGCAAYAVALIESV